MRYSHPCALSLCFSHLPQGMIYEEKRVKCSRGHSFSMLSAGKDWRCDECSSVFEYNPRLRCNKCDVNLCGYCLQKQVRVRESTPPSSLLCPVVFQRCQGHRPLQVGKILSNLHCYARASFECLNCELVLFLCLLVSPN